MKCMHCDRTVRGTGIILDDGVLHKRCERPFSLAKEGLEYQCPKCRTSGKVDHLRDLVEKEVPLAPGETPTCAYNGCMGCGMCIREVKIVKVPRKIECDLCHGKGYLPKEPTPVTAVVDWKL